MSEDVYLKCPCKECGNRIEFPASAAGNTVACPHCGQWTELAGPEKKAEAISVRVGLLPLIGCVVLVLAAASGGFWFWQQQGKKPTVNGLAAPTSPAKAALAPVAKSAPSPANTSESSPAPAIAESAPKPPTRPKSPEDSKVGAIQLEKTKGSSLVYANGTVNNDSEYERYGVRINLDLINNKGGKIGTATDYAESLAPHQQWQFHALVVDPKTVVARVASLKEDQ